MRCQKVFDQSTTRSNLENSVSITRLELLGSKVCQDAADDLTHNFVANNKTSWCPVYVLPKLEYLCLRRRHKNSSNSLNIIMSSQEIGAFV